MKLTKTTDFALRIITYLASEKRKETMPDLSKKLEIPYNNLTKLIQVLSKSSIIRTHQGKYGGITLDKKPEKINLREIIELIDGPTELAICNNRKSIDCKLIKDCKIKNKFNILQGQINSMFEDVTIAQMI